jgi:hypothetical protein
VFNFTSPSIDFQQQFLLGLQIAYPFLDDSVRYLYPIEKAAYFVI